jgi:hypothetical protein
MPHEFASQEWIDSVWAALRGSHDRLGNAPTWAHGPIALVLQAQPDAGFGADVILRLDLHEGEPRDLRAGSADQLRLVPTVISAPYARWKRILQGPGSIVDSILQSRLQLRGDLPLVVRHRELFDAIVAAAAGVSTSYPDDVPAEQGAAAR